MTRVLSLLALVALFACSSGLKPEPGPTPDPVPAPVLPVPDPTAKLLYNGIELPAIWPPKVPVSAVLEGMSPFYLASKPDVIDISLGRQLFVDDFLIAHSTVKRVWHQAEYYPANPVFFPEEEWEMTAEGAVAAPFSDGVWYDESDSKFKMWYMAGGRGYETGFVTCYAESADGITWTRPSLNYVKGTNIVLKGLNRDSNTIWIDKTESDPNLRFKMFVVAEGKSHWGYHYYTSSDGKYWRSVNESGKVADRSTVFYNPFRGVWVWSLRHNIRLSSSVLVRGRDYMEDADVVAGNKKAFANLESFWFGPWPDEPKHPVYKDVQPAIYNLDAIGYESLMLGVFSSWAGPENGVCASDRVIKRNQLLLGYSRDGWSWFRGDFTPFCAVDDNTDAWNNGNIQSAVGSPLIVGDKLYFYMSGRRLNEAKKEVISTGLATLRRDGCASMSGSGEVVTEILKYSGNYLFINAVVRGSMTVELLDENGDVIPGFSAGECNVVKTDGCKIMVSWKEHSDLRPLNGRNLKIRFQLEDADLYSFWISQTEDGKSSGYTAGGGPSLGKYGIDL